jgi:hypothetical protein
MQHDLLPQLVVPPRLLSLRTRDGGRSRPRRVRDGCLGCRPDELAVDYSEMTVPPGRDHVVYALSSPKHRCVSIRFAQGPGGI